MSEIHVIYRIKNEKLGFKMYRSEKNISRPLSLKIECQLGEYDNMTLLCVFCDKIFDKECT
jgi:hypothetical protein